MLRFNDVVDERKNIFLRVELSVKIYFLKKITELQESPYYRSLHIRR